MLLDHVLQGRRAFLHMERYVDEGTKTYSPFAAGTKAAPQFQPRSDTPSFELVSVIVPSARVVTLQGVARQDLLGESLNRVGQNPRIGPQGATAPGARGKTDFDSYLTAPKGPHRFALRR